jgi:hypothetical protein
MSDDPQLDKSEFVSRAPQVSRVFETWESFPSPQFRSALYH